MSLSDQQLKSLAKRMGFKLEYVVFKSQLQDMDVEYNTPYIINLDNEYAEDGKPNSGTHYTALYIQKDNKGVIKPCYMDSYGVAPPTEVLEFVKRKHVPYNTKCIQSLMSEVCGYYCLSFFYFVTKFKDRSGEIYHDCETWTDLFNDLNKSSEWKANEYMLKHFFQSSDPEHRRNNPVEVFSDFRIIGSESNAPLKAIDKNIEMQEEEER